MAATSAAPLIAQGVEHVVRLHCCLAPLLASACMASRLIQSQGREMKWPCTYRGGSGIVVDHIDIQGSSCSLETQMLSLRGMQLSRNALGVVGGGYVSVTGQLQSG